MKKIILIVVDDNLVSRLLPGYILRPFDTMVQVLECEDGDEALQLIRTHQITHIMLDISMPNQNGIAIAEKIRHTSKESNIRLIAYTADALTMDAFHLKQIGFDDVLLKPLRRTELLSALNLVETSS